MSTNERTTNSPQIHANIVRTNNINEHISHKFEYIKADKKVKVFYLNNIRKHDIK